MTTGEGMTVAVGEANGAVVTLGPDEQATASNPIVKSEMQSITLLISNLLDLKE
jgi:hypothetical protein